MHKLRELLDAAESSMHAEAAAAQAEDQWGPFRFEANALVFQPADSDMPIVVCGRFEIVAETRDADGNEWGKLLRWRDRDGREHEWAMPLSLLAGDGSQVRAHLLDGGLFVAPSRKSREALLSYLGAKNVAARARCVPRVGWHETPAGPVFAMPTGTFGNTGSERLLLQSAHCLEHAFRAAGTLEGWQREVAAKCAGNSRLVFTVSVAFAAPLQYLMDAESGGFHLRGPSAIGKSTALHVSGSVWGGGGVNGYVKSWRATDNGLESVAETHCDTLLCLDEISQTDSRSAGQVAYMLANGTGKLRASRSGEGRPPITWRSLFLSSGEISLADKVREDGRRRTTAGQEVRVLDLPADAGAGTGLFEFLHGVQKPDVFACALRDASRRFYGTAGTAFLRKLTKDAVDRKAWTERANHIRSDFVKTHGPSGADGQVCRTVSRFGLVAAAGELAILMGLTPWPKGEAEKAAATCFLAWLDAWGGTEPAEVRKGIAAVRAFLESHGSSRFETWGEADSHTPDGSEVVPRTVNRAGFRRKDDADRWEYFILPETWKDEVCAGRDAKALARAMVQRELLQGGERGKASRSLTVPGYGRLRLYHVPAATLSDADPELNSEGTEEIP